MIVSEKMRVIVKKSNHGDECKRRFKWRFHCTLDTREFVWSCMKEMRKAAPQFNELVQSAIGLLDVVMEQEFMT
jgi:ribosomal protein L22